ncbi:MAG: GH25 family lysozyme [Bacteroidota bacterium]
MKRFLLLVVFSFCLLALHRLWPPIYEASHRRTDYAVEGIDVSRYQAVFDWKNIAKADLDFAFIKATEGQELSDTHFEHNWNSALINGVKRGAYHFFRPEVSAEIQAQHFFDQVELFPGDLPPVLDLEVKGNLSAEELVNAATSWLQLAEAHYGIKPILYTGQKFYNRYLAGRFDDYPLWLARYSNREPVAACGRAFQFWQYTQSGEIEGIAGKVDLNVFIGRLEELAALCVPAQEPENVEAYFAKGK